MYLLNKYIKSVLWRVAKRLSYIEDARCLKVNQNVFTGTTGNSEFNTYRCSRSSVVIIVGGRTVRPSIPERNKRLFILKTYTGIPSLEFKRYRGSFHGGKAAIS